jgi:hypothetical protein
MAYSKYNSKLEVNENNWVVSLINTKTGIEGALGGHAKIVVEGVKRRSFALLDTEPYIAEFHIAEANYIREETWIPQCFRNTKCDYAIYYSEKLAYDRIDKQYAKLWARSVGGISPQTAEIMIQNIKAEFNDTTARDRASGRFQYAGNWCFYNYNGGHNCTTWAEEKLNLIGLGCYLITDSSKASPSLHVSSRNSCVLL